MTIQLFAVLLMMGTAVQGEQAVPQCEDINDTDTEFDANECKISCSKTRKTDGVAKFAASDWGGAKAFRCMCGDDLFCKDRKFSEEYLDESSISHLAWEFVEDHGLSTIEGRIGRLVPHHAKGAADYEGNRDADHGFHPKNNSAAAY